MANAKALIYRDIEQQDYTLAHTRLKAYQLTHPSDPEAAYLLGQVLVKLEQTDEAEQAFKRVIAMQPGSAVGHGSLGSLLRVGGRYGEAADALRSACELMPGDEDYHLELVECLLRSGREGDAFYECRLLLDRHPECGRGYFTLAKLCHIKEQYSSAIDNYLLALKHAPELIEAHNGLGQCYGTLGNTESSQRHFESLLATKPDHLQSLAGLATLHERSGNTASAYKLVQRVIDSGHRQAAIACVYTNICHEFDACMEAVAYAESTLEGLPMDARSDRRTLHFSLGRRYDKMGKYDRAFAHYQAGNNQFPVSYDPVAHTDLVSNIIHTFTPAYMMSAPRSSTKSERPIFIVGMPRSGTTLVEQVISHHPQVAPGGELEDISNMLISIPEMVASGCGYPLGVPELSAAQLDEMAGAYLAGLNEISTEATRITDKMPHNFMALGLISQLFPGARIIHCRRDPLDTCLSIYFQSFLRLHDYACNLEHIGTHYRQYLRLMQHWNNVLDIPVMEVEYRNMVDDLETDARRLLEFCGLDWDPACLEFHTSKRIVHTASYSQVKQPVYRQSVERWRHYDRHLDELKAALERDF